MITTENNRITNTSNNNDVANTDNSAENIQNTETNNSSISLDDKINELHNKLNKLQKNNEELIKYISYMKNENIIDSELIRSGAKNLKAVKSLLDMTAIDFGENGEIKGLKEQIEKLKLSSDSCFLFENCLLSDIKGADVLENCCKDEDLFSNLTLENINLTKQSDLCKTNPSLAKKLARTLFGA